MARSFSGDKAQLISVIKAGLRHNGFALIDVILEEGSSSEMHTLNKTVKTPLVNVPFAELCPGDAKLQELMGEYR